MTNTFWHPLAEVPEGWPRWALLGAGVIGCLVVFRQMGGDDLAPAGLPGGIVELELAGTEEVAQDVIGRWTQPNDHTGLARSSVHWDFAFILAYGLVSALACVMCAGSDHAVRLLDARLGTALAWGVFLAMALDALENVGLLAMLGAGDGSMGAWPRVAQLSAIGKFGLLFAAWYYCLGILACEAVGLASRLIGR